MHRTTVGTVAGTLAAVAVSALGTACSKHAVPLAATPVAVNRDSLDRARADSAAAAADSARSAEMARAQAVRDSLAANGSGAGDAMATLSAPVYYDYDQAELSDSARTLLLAKARLMQAQPGLRVRITGHTDERGSSEYNLALGLRRAAEARAFLMANGVDGSRVEISSMGEEQPAVQGSNEAAWARNRRAEFAPLTGSDAQ